MLVNKPILVLGQNLKKVTEGKGEFSPSRREFEKRKERE